MIYYIINKDTGRKYRKFTRHAGCWTSDFKSKGAATREMNAKDLHASHYVIPATEYKPKMVERINLMTGKPYMEAEDTPRYCSPASEAYWSM